MAPNQPPVCSTRCGRGITVMIFPNRFAPTVGLVATQIGAPAAPDLSGRSLRFPERTQLNSGHADIDRMQRAGHRWAGLTVNPHFEANSCPSELPSKHKNYGCTNLAPLLQLLRTPSTGNHSYVLIIFPTVPHNLGSNRDRSHANAFANVADVEDHAFNQGRN